MSKLQTPQQAAGNALAMYFQISDPKKYHDLMALCAGLICMSIWCVCSLLVKIIEGKDLGDN